MKIKILLLIIALICFSCNNSDDNDNDIPKCLQVIIDNAEDPDTSSLTGKAKLKDIYLMTKKCFY
jgi:hypothetical protein